MNLEQFKARLIELNNHKKMFDSQLATLAGHINEVTYIISQIENPPVPAPTEPVPAEEANHGEVNEQAEEQAA